MNGRTEIETVVDLIFSFRYDRQESRPTMVPCYKINRIILLGTRWSPSPCVEISVIFGNRN